MNAEPVSSVAAEINRLYEVALLLSAQSRQTLDAALVAAWQAGQLLVAEKKRVRHSMGPSAWLLWLEANFDGTPRTAQRYMKLARSVSDDAFLRGMSLRQAYDRLGIATEPKTPSRCSLTHQLPAHVLLANRLVRALKRARVRATSQEGDGTFRRDLQVLFETLRPWFAGGQAEERRERPARSACPPAAMP